MLELCPFHDEVKVFIQKIVDNPIILASQDTAWHNATLDGEQWTSNETIDAVKSLIPTLPHLSELLSAFF
jgi:hypothetical protein